MNIKKTLILLIILFSMQLYTIRAANKSQDVPVIFLVEPFVENNIFGLAAPYLVKNSPALKNNAAYASFLPYNDFSFSYRITHTIGVIPDVFMGGLAFNKDLNKKMTVSGYFSILNCGNISITENGILQGNEGYQSYVFHPAFTYKLKYQQALAGDVEFFFEEYEKPVFKPNIGLAYAKYFGNVKMGEKFELENIAAGLYVKNVAGLFSKNASPGTISANGSVSFWKGRIGFGLGLGFTPHAAEAFSLDLGLKGHYKIVSLNLGFFALGPEKNNLNLSLSVKANNFEITYGLKNLLRHNLPLYSSSVKGGVEQMIGVNIYYSTSMVVDPAKMIKNLKKIERFMEQAEKLYDKGKYGQALSVWQEVLRIDNTHEKALKNIEHTKKKIRNEIKLKLKEGKRLYRDKQYIKAMNTFKIVLSYEENNPEAKKFLNLSRKKMQEEKENYYNIAAMEFKNKNYEDALQSIKNALLIDPDFLKARELKVKIEEKVDQLRRIAERKAKGKKLITRGNEALSNQNYNGAVDLYKEAQQYGIDENRIENLVENVAIQKEYDRKKEKADNLYLQAKIKFNKGDLVAGIKLLSQVLALVPDHAKALKTFNEYKDEKERLFNKYNKEAKTAFNKQQYLQARKNWQLAHNLEPQNREVNIYLKEVNNKLEKLYEEAVERGRTLERDNKLILSRKSYKKALSYKPGDEDLQEKIARLGALITKKYQTYREKGIQLFSQKQYAAAKKQFLQVLEANEDDATALEYVNKIENMQKVKDLYAKLQIKYQNRNFREASRLLKEIEKINPDHPGLDQYKEKLEEELLAIERENKLAQQFQNGVKAFKSKEFDKAISIWTQISNRDPENQMVREYIRLAHKRKKEAEDKDYNDGIEAMDNEQWFVAREKLGSALDANPENDKAREALNEVNIKLEEIKEKSLQKGKVQFENARYAKAQENFETVLKVDEQDIESEDMLYK
ncbi:MAG TPA: hypothetical protein VKS21_05470, partial [Spirochaetota bacterium]|nr:hypothetical protein [Spirochaetota bacterium]